MKICSTRFGISFKIPFGTYSATCEHYKCLCESVVRCPCKCQLCTAVSCWNGAVLSSVGVRCWHPLTGDAQGGLRAAGMGCATGHRAVHGDLLCRRMDGDKSLWQLCIVSLWVPPLPWATAELCVTAHRNRINPSKYAILLAPGTFPGCSVRHASYTGGHVQFSVCSAPPLPARCWGSTMSCPAGTGPRGCVGLGEAQELHVAAAGLLLWPHGGNGGRVAAAALLGSLKAQDFSVEGRRLLGVYRVVTAVAKLETAVVQQCECQGNAAVGVQQHFPPVGSEFEELLLPGIGKSRTAGAGTCKTVKWRGRNRSSSIPSVELKCSFKVCTTQTAVTASHLLKHFYSLHRTERKLPPVVLTRPCGVPCCPGTLVPASWVFWIQPPCYKIRWSMQRAWPQVSQWQRPNTSIPVCSHVHFMPPEHGKKKTRECLGENSCGLHFVHKVDGDVGFPGLLLCLGFSLRIECLKQHNLNTRMKTGLFSLFFLCGAVLLMGHTATGTIPMWTARGHSALPPLSLFPPSLLDRKEGGHQHVMGSTSHFLLPVASFSFSLPGIDHLQSYCVGALITVPGELLFRWHHEESLLLCWGGRRALLGAWHCQVVGSGSQRQAGGTAVFGCPRTSTATGM